ncbi:MAG: TlpA family protein disulfide reductase [Tannerella sp.]|jgi:peroxiredoxin|nr:TlpA family protein disulfide reductase [Tannerella sp.]
MSVKYYFLLLVMFLLPFSCAGGNREKNDRDASVAEVKGAVPEGRALLDEEAVDERGYIVKIGDVAPDFALQLTNGESFKLSGMRGKVVMLQFTASWCGVCRKEMPFIESEIWRKYKDNPGFCLLGIDRDEPVEKVRDFIKQTGISYPVALDPGGDVFALYAERKAGITRNVIINPDGRIVMLTRLYNEDEFAEMCRVIGELVN